MANLTDMTPYGQEKYLSWVVVGGDPRGKQANYSQTGKVIHTGILYSNIEPNCLLIYELNKHLNTQKHILYMTSGC